MSEEAKNEWKPDQYEAHFLDKLKLTNFVKLKTPLMARSPEPVVYLFRNWATLMFLGQAYELMKCLDIHLCLLKAGAANEYVIVPIRALFCSVVVHLRAALDSLAGEVDLLLCDGDPKDKRISMHERCFRCRLKKEAKSRGVAVEIIEVKKLLDALEEEQWYKDSRAYRNEVGHRLPGFLYFKRPSSGHKGRRVRILKPNLSDKRIAAIFSAPGKGQAPQKDDFAGPGYIEEQLRRYLEQTVELVDAVWGHLATYVKTHEDMLDRLA